MLFSLCLSDRLFQKSRNSESIASLSFASFIPGKTIDSAISSGCTSFQFLYTISCYTIFQLGIKYFRVYHLFHCYKFTYCYNLKCRFDFLKTSSNPGNSYIWLINFFSQACFRFLSFASTFVSKRLGSCFLFFALRLNSGLW